MYVLKRHIYITWRLSKKLSRKLALDALNAFAACFEVPALKFLKYPWQCFQNGIWHEWHAMAVILKIVLCKIPTSLFDTCRQDWHMWHECLRLTHVCFFLIALSHDSAARQIANISNTIIGDYIYTYWQLLQSILTYFLGMGSIKGLRTSPCACWGGVDELWIAQATLSCLSGGGVDEHGITPICSSCVSWGGVDMKRPPSSWGREYWGEGGRGSLLEKPRSTSSSCGRGESKMVWMMISRRGQRTNWLIASSRVSIPSSSFG